MPFIKDADIGGAKIMRGFNMGSERKTPRDPDLTRDQLLSMPSANRQALHENGMIQIYPPAMLVGKRYAVSAGFGVWNVYEGRKVNSTGLTRAEAEALAAEGPYGRADDEDEPEPVQEPGVNGKDDPEETGKAVEEPPTSH